MSELIKALVVVKDPFTLLAFVAVVLLLALRTKTVPQLFFGLLKDKLTKEKFAQLLHRVMVYGFLSFIILCGLAVLGQILAYKAKAQPASLDEIKTEIKNLGVDESRGRTALEEYQKGLVLIGEQNFDEAINSLKASIDQVRTLSSEYTIAYILHERGRDQEANEHIIKAADLARSRGDSLGSVKVDQLSQQILQKIAPRPLPVAKGMLPKGGNSLREPEPITQGAYISADDYPRGPRYFKISLRANQTLTITFITPDNDYAAVGVRIYDVDTTLIPGKEAGERGRRSKGSLEYSALADGYYFIAVDIHEASADVAISVR